MNQLLSGDNQFFGINHMSEEKARTQAMRFRETEAIISVLDAAYDEGVRTFMCTTHDRISEICDHVRNHPDRYSGFQFYLCMPLLLNTLNEIDIINPIICSNINKIGFRMSGGLEHYINILQTRELRSIAMSVYASGAIEPREAIEWLSEQPNIEAIVFGVSSRRNIRNTVELVETYF